MREIAEGVWQWTPGELEGRAGDRETLIVLTNPSHERAARSLVERLEHTLPSHDGPTDCAALEWALA